MVRGCSVGGHVQEALFGSVIVGCPFGGGDVFKNHDFSCAFYSCILGEEVMWLS
jgi:hypothetical protein